MIQYKGQGEHSVRELELIISQREEELHLYRSGQKRFESIPKVSNEELRSKFDKRFLGGLSDEVRDIIFDFFAPHLSCSKEVTPNVLGEEEKRNLFKDWLEEECINFEKTRLEPSSNDINAIVLASEQNLINKVLNKYRELLPSKPKEKEKELKDEWITVTSNGVMPTEKTTVLMEGSYYPMEGFYINGKCVFPEKYKIAQSSK